MSVKGRTSYSGLMRQPAWLLYDHRGLVASVRAKSADDARRIFIAHGLRGDYMKRGK